MQGKSRCESKFGLLFQNKLFSRRLSRSAHMCSSLCSFDDLFGEFQECAEVGNETRRDQNAP